MKNLIDKSELISKLQTLEGLTNEERSNLIGLLRQHKKYGLVWEDKPEDVEERLREELPILREVKDKAILSDVPDAPNHILIEGDNLEALTALSYTHEGKIDVIYIDPPYNTGHKDFTYNDNAFVKDIQKYYNTLLYSFYNIYGERVKSMLVSFDFDNSTITVNGNTLKVVEDSDFVYKVLKTKVKAIDGIKGLYKYILEAMHVESPFNCVTWSILAKIGNIEE